MQPDRPTDDSALSVLHCFRPLVGGVFRHVIDLARGQAERGLNVGIICDSLAVNERAESALRELEPECALGVHRLPITRRLHLSDLATQRKIVAIAAAARPDIVHGHGAKGGAFARLLPARIDAKIAYTPHGGVLHYSPSSLAGRYYFALERFLRRSTDGLIFVSKFGAAEYARKIGEPVAHTQVIYNGLHASDFYDRDVAVGACDFVFAGEMRMLKGLSTLLEATARIAQRRHITVALFGDGPDAGFVTSRIRKLGLDDAVTLHAPVSPITRAFAQGRVAVVPSHAESFPYIVLEAIAAGVPLIATRVGGIPEIFGEFANELVPPEDVDALDVAMTAALDRGGHASAAAAGLTKRVRAQFMVPHMVESSVAFYRQLLGKV